MGRIKYLHDGLGTDPLDLLAPAGALCLAGDGQALEWVRLKGAGHVAHGAHHRELPGSLCLGGSTDGSAGDDGRHIGWLVVIKRQGVSLYELCELSLCAT